MKQRSSLVLLLGLLPLLFSCSTTFTAWYDTRLDPPQSDPLKLEDDKFAFQFQPLNNGIYFKVFNKTDKPAYLVWEKSFFIQPDGNSYKAANTDLLDTASKLTQNQKDESTIPSHAYIARFTTPANNIQEFKYEQITTVTSQLYTTPFAPTLITSGNTTLSDFFKAGSFFPLSSVTLSGENLTSATLNRMGTDLIEHIKANDNLGLGFYIMYDDKPTEYQFTFKFIKVSIYASELNQGKQVYLAYVAEAKDGWVWHEIKRPSALNDSPMSQPLVKNH